jgi:hypothetical protein
LEGYGFTEQDLRGALAGAQSALLGSGSEAVKEKAIMAIIKTLDSVWILTIVAGAVSLVSGLFMKWEKLALQAVGA